MPDTPRDRPHIFLSGGSEKEPYTSTRRGGKSNPPSRQRQEHAERLLGALGSALSEARSKTVSEDDFAGERGYYLEFQVTADKKDAFEGLENRQSGIELLAAQPANDQSTVTAAVFVPEKKADFYTNKVTKYRDEETDKGNPRNQALVSRIETASLATTRSLYTGNPNHFPRAGERVWWEVWLRGGASTSFGETQKTSVRFREVARRFGIDVAESYLQFPERTIVLGLATTGQLESVLRNSDVIAELRLARDTPAFFTELSPIEEQEWVRDLSQRVTPGKTDVSVCVLDSGMTRLHPLIQPFLAPADMHSYKPNDWGVNDSIYWKGHGTAVGGMSLYGDLTPVLSGNSTVKIDYCLESVRILPLAGHNNPELYGLITEDAVARVEIENPNRRRVFNLAVTSNSEDNRGQPSSWSATIDRICFGEEGASRLYVIAAGNIRGGIDPDAFPDRNDVEGVENPAQSWNAVVVGACTHRVRIEDPQYSDWEPLAEAGELCPTSRTSIPWERKWPVRPDVVAEGGNLATDGTIPAMQMEDLSLLTSYYQPTQQLLTTFGDTSAATALVSRMAAELMVQFPSAWPETIRALIIHSAEWTPAMKATFGDTPQEKDKRHLLQRYGYGVPNLERALRSARNDLTLVVEDTITPYKLKDSRISTNEMNLHQFPWPRDILQGLGELDAEVRVTLSYFIEPSPEGRGWARRHRYASHGLRFFMKGLLEEDRDFKQRINRVARDNDYDSDSSAFTDADKWFLGSNVRDKGSIHSDYWQGSAADLAQRDAIAVVPVGGWWKEKKYLERWDRQVRYSLIVSVRVPDADVDIYTPVANALSVPIILES